MLFKDIKGQEREVSPTGVTQESLQQQMSETDVFEILWLFFLKVTVSLWLLNRKQPFCVIRKREGNSREKYHKKKIFWLHRWYWFLLLWKERKGKKRNRNRGTHSRDEKWKWYRISFLTLESPVRHEENRKVLHERIHAMPAFLASRSVKLTWGRRK